MDLPFSAGEPSESSYNRGYFAAQALRAGMFAFPGDFPPGAMLPPFYGMNMIERETLKERIREEIIAREMMERRILEEEVRRELDFEHAMLARRYTENVLSERVLETGLKKAEVEFGRRTPTIFDLPAKRKNAESLPIAQIDPSKLTGIKRKSACGGVFPKPTTWGCALCKVSCNTLEALEEHLKGKKHKSKASQLAGSKAAVVVDSPSSSTKKDDDIPIGKSFDLTNTKASHQPKRKFVSESTVFRKRIFKKPSIWRCELCELECNSGTMLNEHIKGKKHNSMLKVLEKKNRVKTETILNATDDVIDKRPNEVKENGKKEAISEENSEKLKTLTTVNTNNTGVVIDKKIVEVKQDEKKETSNKEEMKKDNDQEKVANNKEEIKKVYVVEKEDDNEEEVEEDRMMKEDKEVEEIQT